MENNRHILVANISMANFLQETKFYYDKHHPSIVEDAKESKLLRRGGKAIESHIWKCYPPLSMMGKNNRELSSDETSSLLQNVKHIDDIHLLTYYKKLTHAYLERTFITIVFFNYKEDDTTEYLKNILYIESILKPAAKNGSIDVLSLEKKAKKSRRTSRYLFSPGKHPVATFLGINPRTLTSFGGNKNEKK